MLAREQDRSIERLRRFGGCADAMEVWAAEGSTTPPPFLASLFPAGHEVRHHGPLLFGKVPVPRGGPDAAVIEERLLHIRRSRRTLLSKRVDPASS